MKMTSPVALTVEVLIALPVAALVAMGAPPRAEAPAAHQAAGAPVLTLVDAVSRGLEHNLAAVLSRSEAVGAAGAAKVARAALRPSLAAQASAARDKIDLEAYGFPVAPGESPLIGPFNVADVRLSGEVPLLDLRARAASRSAAETARAAQATAADVRDAVVLAVSRLYLEAAAAESRIAAARAEVDTERALFDKARHMKEAGLVPGIEVLRAKVQLASGEQRLIVAENAAATGRLALAQAIGMPLDDPFVLEALPTDVPPQDVELETALQRAAAARGDLAAARAALAAADHALAAARRAVLPIVVGHADVGRIGPDLGGLETTYSAMAAVRVPLYSGGEIRGGTIQAEARLDEARARLADLQRRVEYDVRAALLDLRAADQRARVAQEASGVADAQLEQARDRFAAGVASGVEVVQAQEAAASAHENAIASLLADSEARVALARAMGTADENLADLMGGRL